MRSCLKTKQAIYIYWFVYVLGVCGHTHAEPCMQRLGRRCAGIRSLLLPCGAWRWSKCVQLLSCLTSPTRNFGVGFLVSPAVALISSHDYHHSHFAAGETETERLSQRSDRTEVWPSGLCGLLCGHCHSIWETQVARCEDPEDRWWSQQLCLAQVRSARWVSRLCPQPSLDLGANDALSVQTEQIWKI